MPRAVAAEVPMILLALTLSAALAGDPPSHAFRIPWTRLGAMEDGTWGAAVPLEAQPGMVIRVWLHARSFGPLGSARGVDGAEVGWDHRGLTFGEHELAVVVPESGRVELVVRHEHDERGRFMGRWWVQTLEQARVHYPTLRAPVSLVAPTAEDLVEYLMESHLDALTDPPAGE